MRIWNITPRRRPARRPAGGLPMQLTDDLDTVYKELMALGTNGGEEYVARVVTRAAADLEGMPALA